MQMLHVCRLYFKVKLPRCVDLQELDIEYHSPLQFVFSPVEQDGDSAETLAWD